MSVSSPQADAVQAAERRVTTPVAGALAGIAFSLLFGTSMAMLITTMTVLDQDTGAWLDSGASRFRFALGLLPFAGMAFLWFIAVSRQRLGKHEDQFFATVLLGSGLLFLATMFSAAASAGAMAVGYAADPSAFVGSGAYAYARNVVAQIFNVYALRMAAVFVFAQATLWMRTGVMPRWLALLSYAVGLLLLLVVTQSTWVVLVFPGWVLIISIYILVTHPRHAG